MGIKNLSLPEFLFAEFPIKDKSFNDDRMFIVHRGISLIEVIDNYLITNIVFDEKIKKEYTYFGESFTLTYHTNNVEYLGLNEFEVLDKAWSWYRDYLIWADTTDLDRDLEL